VRTWEETKISNAEFEDFAPGPSPVMIIALCRTPGLKFPIALHTDFERIDAGIPSVIEEGQDISLCFAP
jgi:hypothetical protein